MRISINRRQLFKGIMAAEGAITSVRSARLQARNILRFRPVRSGPARECKKRVAGVALADSCRIISRAGRSEN